MKPDVQLQEPEAAVIETKRLLLRRIALSDAAFIVRLLNEPSFRQYIGDRNVRTVDDARAYIERVHLASYQANGFGAFLVVTRADAQPLGICGLMVETWLDAPDIAYAFVPTAGGRGYALEAAAGVMEYAHRALGLTRVVAIVQHDNERSIRLLQKLGYRQDGTVVDPRDGHELAFFVHTQP
jgi:RimJ/RimL family protein N-acetyltransferase